MTSAGRLPRCAITALLASLWYLLLVQLPASGAGMGRGSWFVRFATQSIWLAAVWPIATDVLRGVTPLHPRDREDFRRVRHDDLVGRARLAVLWGFTLAYAGLVFGGLGMLALGRGHEICWVGALPGAAVMVLAPLVPPLIALVDLARDSFGRSQRGQLVDATGPRLVVALAGGKRRVVESKTACGSGARPERIPQAVWLSGGQPPDPKSSPYRDHDDAWTEVRIETSTGRRRRLREVLASVFDLLAGAVAPIVWAHFLGAWLGGAK